MQWYEWWPMVMKTNYADFSGRARRKEYWFFALSNVLITVAGLLVLGFFEGIVTGGACFSGTGEPLLAGLFNIVFQLALFIPNAAILTRRLHDIGKSGWWWLIAFVPLVGGLVLLLFAVREGDKGSNQYGPSPK